jgi:hypothetical protein
MVGGRAGGGGGAISQRCFCVHASHHDPMGAKRQFRAVGRVSSARCCGNKVRRLNACASGAGFELLMLALGPVANKVTG